MGNYSFRTYEDFSSEADLIAKGLLSLGLKSYDKICIFSETRAEWMVTAFACFKANITIVTIYANLGNDGIVHVLNETQVSHLVCSDETMLKVAQVIHQCPTVTTIIAFESPVNGRINSQIALTNANTGLMIHGYQDIMRLPSSYLNSVKPPQPKDCAVIMYTSGSTGLPKGVLISHENMVASVSAFINCADYKSSDRYIAYLPLAHIFELMVEAGTLFIGMKIGYRYSNHQKYF